jgi:hypothetical protein
LAAVLPVRAAGGCLRAVCLAHQLTAVGVRRDKAALFQWVKAPPGDSSSRKQPEQLWR